MKIERLQSAKRFSTFPISCLILILGAAVILSGCGPKPETAGTSRNSSAKGVVSTAPPPPVLPSLAPGVPLETQVGAIANDPNRSAFDKEQAISHLRAQQAKQGGNP